MSRTRNRRRAVWSFRFAVLLAGGMVGWMMGRLAPLLYFDLTARSNGRLSPLCDTVGPLVGLGSGLYAGFLWWLAMREPLGLTANSGARKPIRRGFGWGTFVGGSSAFFVHIALALIEPERCGFGFLVGVPAGMAAGSLLGSILAIVGLALSRFWSKSEPNPLESRPEVAPLRPDLATPDD